MYTDAHAENEGERKRKIKNKEKEREGREREGGERNKDIVICTHTPLYTYL